MRSLFVVPCLLIMLGCSRTGDPHLGSSLPGFPLAAPGEADGPHHVQILSALEGETAVVIDWSRSDGRPARALELRVDRGGQVIGRARLPVDESMSPDAHDEIDLRDLPVRLEFGVIEKRSVDGRWEVLLSTEDSPPIQARLASIPRVRSTTIEGAAVAGSLSDEPPSIGAIAWRSLEDGALVRGVTILDLRSGRAHLHQRRGIAAHKEGDFVTAAAHFEAAWGADPMDPLGAYNLACALTHLGQHERALTFLWEAVRLDGPRIRVMAARDPDLNPLREDPRFIEIVGPGGRPRRSSER